MFKFAIITLILSIFLAVLGPRFKSSQQCSKMVNLMIDTDLFSDCDDTAALLLACTQPCARLLGVNVNFGSTYSVLAASSILTYYGHGDVPVGAIRPLSNQSFFDTYFYELGEYASKVQFHWNRTLKDPEDAWEPAALYRHVLENAEDGSVTIVSLGFLDNLSALLNTTGSLNSSLTGAQLIERKVAQLVIMGGEYPSGWEFNFGGNTPLTTAHVVNNWPGNMTFSGIELGGNISAGAQLTIQGPTSDPVVSAYKWYIGYGLARFAWDPLATLFAIEGLSNLFQYGIPARTGYNHVLPNGTNYWVDDGMDHGQAWLKLADGVSNVTAGATLDRLWLKAVWENI